MGSLVGLLLGLYGFLRLLPLGGYGLCSPKFCEVGDGENVSGFVVRSERLLLSADASVLSTLADGQWVGAGQQVALGYTEEQSSLTVSASGYYSSFCDGYEAVLTRERLDRLCLKELNALQPQALPEEVYGRLVTGQSWYYACVLPQERQKDCALGKKLSLCLENGEFPMEVFRIGQAEGGEFLLILRCDQQMEAVLNLRQAQGSLVFGGEEGLLIPKDVLCMKNGKTGVYVLQCGIKRFKEVKILCFQEDKVLVEEDRSTVKGLRIEDQIILP